MKKETFFSYQNIINFLSKKSIVLSIVFALFIISLFFYLYYLPFGFSKERTYSAEELLTEEANLILDQGSSFYEEQGNFILDGTSVFRYRPKIKQLDLNISAEVKGDNIYIVPNKLNSMDSDFHWDYSKNLTPKDSNSEYIEINEYKPEDSTIFSVRLIVSPDWELIKDSENKNSQIILKYNDFKIIQSNNQFLLTVDQYFEDTLSSTNVSYTIPEKYLTDTKKSFEILGVYKKPLPEENGYIKMYVNNKLSGFRNITSFQKYLTEVEYTYPWYPVSYNNELIKDLSQDIFTLKQEQYTKELLEEFIKRGKPVTSLYYTYSMEFEPNGRNYKNLVDSGLPFTDLYSQYFKFENGTFTQSFYPKQFFDNFKGNIYSLNIANFDITPFVTKTLLSFEETPADVFLWSNHGTLMEFVIEIEKENILNRNPKNE